ncbi:MAG: hypothetical protein IJ168_03295 [Eubacterium sp.]|nr:hypothetical protein [Eubacterium sp.]
MGRGSYTAADWVKLSRRRNLTQQADHKTIYTNSTAQAEYTAAYIRQRESRDSEDSPTATPIILGFDVTASMGYLAKELAVHTLHETVRSLYTGRYVPYPHILCAAIGDCKSDRYPLQATQFEADDRILRQLLSLCLEGGGGGNGGESYNLLWYFAAHHTSADAFEKRHEKGIIITVGNDYCHPSLSREEIERVFRERVPYPLSNEELLQQVSEKYQVFHIHIEDGSAADNAVLASWRALLGGHVTVIDRKDIDVLDLLITSVLAIAGGASANRVLKAANQADAERIARSVALIRTDRETKQDNNIISF